jgi:toxin ParE1/3/4
VPPVDHHPNRHFERSRPTLFLFTFAPANVSACAERNLSSLLLPAATNRLVQKTFRATDLLARNPAIGRVPGTRELVIPGTPYIVPYRVRANAVEILRVFHAARKWPKT